MIIRNVTAILAAIFLVTVCSQADARKHHHKHHKNYYQHVRVTKVQANYYSYGSLVYSAERYLGTNPTGWRHVWCGRFMAMIAPDKASKIKNPNRARDWATLPGAHRGNGNPGDIVVLSRGSGGHVGVLKGYDGAGNLIIISGNHGRSVGEGVYPAYRVIAVVPG